MAVVVGMMMGIEGEKIGGGGRDIRKQRGIVRKEKEEGEVKVESNKSSKLNKRLTSDPL